MICGRCGNEQCQCRSGSLPAAVTLAPWNGVGGPAGPAAAFEATPTRRPTAPGCPAPGPLGPGVLTGGTIAGLDTEATALAPLPNRDAAPRTEPFHAAVLRHPLDEQTSDEPAETTASGVLPSDATDVGGAPEGSVDVAGSDVDVAEAGSPAAADARLDPAADRADDDAVNVPDNAINVASGGEAANDEALDVDLDDDPDLELADEQPWTPVTAPRTSTPPALAIPTTEPSPFAAPPPPPLLAGVPPSMTPPAPVTDAPALTSAVPVVAVTPPPPPLVAPWTPSVDVDVDVVVDEATSIVAMPVVGELASFSAPAAPSAPPPFVVDEPVDWNVGAATDRFNLEDILASEADSLVLGDAGDVVQTFTIEARPSSGRMMGIGATPPPAPMQIFVGGDVARLLEADVVLRRRADPPPAGALSPFEHFVMKNVDGVRTVLEVQEHMRLSENDLRIVLALLLDKQLIELGGPMPTAPPPAQAGGAEVESPWTLPAEAMALAPMPATPSLMFALPDLPIDVPMDLAPTLPGEEIALAPMQATPSLIFALPDLPIDPPQLSAFDEPSPLGSFVEPPPPLSASFSPAFAPSPAFPIAPAFTSATSKQSATVTSAPSSLPSSAWAFSSPASGPVAAGFTMSASPTPSAFASAFAAPPADPGAPPSLSSSSPAFPATAFPSSASPAFTALPGPTSAPRTLPLPGQAPAAPPRPNASVGNSTLRAGLLIAGDHTKAAALHAQCIRELKNGTIERAHQLARQALNAAPDMTLYQDTLSEWPQFVAAHRTPDDVRARAQAVIAEEAGDFDKALTLLQQAVQTNPKNASAWNRLAVLLAMRKNDINGALEAAQKAVELVPDDATYLSNFTKFAALAEKRGGLDQKGRGLWNRLLGK